MKVTKGGRFRPDKFLAIFFDSVIIEGFGFFRQGHFGRCVPVFFA